TSAVVRSWGACRGGGGVALDGGGRLLGHREREAGDEGEHVAGDAHLDFGGGAAGGGDGEVVEDAAALPGDERCGRAGAVGGCVALQAGDLGALLGGGGREVAGQEVQ